MKYERAEGSYLKLCEVIRHVHPDTSKGITKRIIWHIVQCIFDGLDRRQSTRNDQRIIDRHPRHRSRLQQTHYITLQNNNTTSKMLQNHRYQNKIKPLQNHKRRSQICRQSRYFVYICNVARHWLFGSAGITSTNGVKRST